MIPEGVYRSLICQSIDYTVHIKYALVKSHSIVLQRDIQSCGIDGCPAWVRQKDIVDHVIPLLSHVGCHTVLVRSVFRTSYRTVFSLRHRISFEMRLATPSFTRQEPHSS